MLRRGRGSIRAGRRAGWRLLAVLVLTAAAVCGLGGVALAHAELDATDPAGGATLPVAPTQLHLTFSEPVQVSPTSGIRLFRADGSEVSGVGAYTDGANVVAHVPEANGSGTYLVRWRALSDDGHVVTGTLTYTVAGSAGGGAAGQSAAGPPAGARAAGAPAAGDGSAADTRWADVVRSGAEAASSAGVALLLGGLALWWLTGSPAGPGLAVPRRHAALGAGAVAVGGLVVLAVTAARIDGRWAGIASWQAWSEVVATPSGRALVVRVLAGVVATALVLTRRHRLAAVAGAVAAVALPLGGHASSDRSPALAGGLLVAHVVAASVWTGAVVTLVPLVRPARRPELRLALRATGILAGGGAFVLLVTGAVEAVRKVPGWSALTGTGYGIALLIKVGLLVAVLGLGAVGLRASRDPSAARIGPLRRTLPFEAGLLGVALVAAGALSTLRPPTAVATAIGASTRVVAIAQGRATVRFRPEPGRLGVDLSVTASSGTPDDVVPVVFARPAGTILPPRSVPLQRLGTGRFTADAVTLPAVLGTAAGPSAWQLTVTLTRPDGSRDTFAVPATVPPIPAGATP